MNPSTLRSVRHLLNLAIVLHAVGLTIIFFRSQHTNFGNYMFMVMEIAHAKAYAIERICVSVFLLLTFVNFFLPRAVFLIPIFLYVLFEAWAGYFQGGYHFSELTLGAQALRYTTPLAVMMLLAWPFRRVSDAVRAQVCSWVLRIALAVVFITHGAECLMKNPQFVDLIIGSFNNMFGFRFTESAALKIMLVIGWVDILVAITVLINPNKYLLGWLLFWAALTAFSRMTALGFGAYTEVLMRASHILAPLAVYLLHYKKEPKRTILNDSGPLNPNDIKSDSYA